MAGAGGGSVNTSPALVPLCSWPATSAYGSYGGSTAKRAVEHPTEIITGSLSAFLSLPIDAVEKHPSHVSSDPWPAWQRSPTPPFSSETTSSSVGGGVLSLVSASA